jgi:hypothetical protein
VGDNQFGQLGDSTTERRIIPTLVSALTPVGIVWSVPDIYLGQKIDFSGYIKLYGSQVGSVSIFVDLLGDAEDPLIWYENSDIVGSSFDLSEVPSIKSDSYAIGVDNNGIDIVAGNYKITLVVRKPDNSVVDTVVREISVLNPINGNNVGEFNVDKTSGTLRSIFHFNVVPNESTSQVRFIITESGLSQIYDSGFGINKSRDLITFDYRFTKVGNYSVTAYPVNTNGQIIGDGTSIMITVSEPYYIVSLSGPKSSDVDELVHFEISTSMSTSDVFYQIILRNSIQSVGYAHKTTDGSFSIDTQFPQAGIYRVAVFPCDENGVLSDSILSKTLEHSVYGNSLFDQFPSDSTIFDFELAKLSAEFSLLAYENTMITKDGIYYNGSNGTELPTLLRDTLLNKHGFRSESKSIITNNYGDDVDPHNIAYTFATRMIKTDTGEIRPFVVVVLRGTFGNEWQGNMEVTGDSYDESIDYHYSFYRAAVLVYANLIGYMNNNDLTEAMILVTGHSRGAAVGNILSALLTDRIDSETRIGGVVSYLFATPNAVKDHNQKAPYMNIFNFSFTDDFVPQVPLNTEGWNYGKYGYNYVNTAKRFYSDDMFISDFYKAAIYSYDRVPEFNSKKTRKTLDYWANTWKSVDSYYNWNLNSSIFYGYDTMYDFMRDVIAVLANDKSTSADKVAAVILLSNMLDDSYCNLYLYPVLEFFLDGQVLNNYINDTHSPLTYYYALVSGGFNVIPELSGSAAQSSFFNETINSRFSNSLSFTYDTFERAKLYEFASFGENISKLGWNLEDPTSWSGVKWSNSEDSKVESISLPYLGLSGSIDLSQFSELVTIDLRGNSIDNITVNDCAELVYLNVDYNDLHALNLTGVPNLKELHASFNQLDSLDTTTLLNLSVLDASNNNINTLNLSNNTQLKELYLSNNFISSLVIEGLGLLEAVDVSHNKLNVATGTTIFIQLMEIDQKYGGWVSFGDQRIEDYAAFVADEITSLRAFALMGNNESHLNWESDQPKDWIGVTWERMGDVYRVVRINIANYPVEGILDLTDIPYLTYLNVSGTQLSSLDISNSINLKHVNASYAKLHSLKLNEGLGLEVLFINNNYLDLSESSALYHYIQNYSEMIASYEGQTEAAIPVVRGVADHEHYNQDVTIEFDEGIASINGIIIETGITISREGSYALLIEYNYGLVFQIEFEIDKTAPVITVNPYLLTPTNQDIVVSASTNEGILSAESYVCSENGDYTFTATDEAGNVSSVTVKITNIDKTAPIITVEPYTTVKTEGPITVFVKTNEGVLDFESYTFSTNSSFTFTAIDEAGNVSNKMVTITNISKAIEVSSSVIGLGGELAIIGDSTPIESNTKVFEGIRVEYVATPIDGYIVYQWLIDGVPQITRDRQYVIDAYSEYVDVKVEFVMVGDLNNDDQSSTTDLVMLRRYIAGLIDLDPKGLVGADLDYNTTISTTDLVKLRRRLAGLE